MVRFRIRRLSIYEDRDEIQSLLRLAFPPQCVGCDELVEREFGLCGSCWRETPFLTGLVCEICGAPLPGEDSGRPEHCDDCLTIARPWHAGRAALLYRDKVRQLVLKLKHGDRLDLVRPAAQWMIGVGAKLITQKSVIVPVPAHPIRLFRRRYNQAALLGNEIARVTNTVSVPDLLRRVRRTKIQDGMSREERFANVTDAIHPAERAKHALNGRDVVLMGEMWSSSTTS